MLRLTMVGRSAVALTVLLAWAPPSGAQVQPVEALMAVDAEGRTLGRVVRVDYTLRQMQVVMEVEGELAIVQVLADSFSHGARPVVYFASRTCFGSAYMSARAGEDAFGGRIAVAGPRGTLYRGFGEPRLLTVRSVLRGGECVQLGTPRMELIDALPVLDLVDSFTPPYRLVPIQRSEPPARSEPQRLGPPLRQP